MKYKELKHIYCRLVTLWFKLMFWGGTCNGVELIIHFAEHNLQSQIKKCRYLCSVSVSTGLTWHQPEKSISGWSYDIRGVVLDDF